MTITDPAAIAPFGEGYLYGFYWSACCRLLDHPVRLHDGWIDSITWHERHLFWGGASEKFGGGRQYVARSS